MTNTCIIDEINSTNYSTIRQIYKPQVGYSGFVTSLTLTINLKSIPGAEFPYIPDSTPADVVEQTFQNLEETLQFKVLRILYRKNSEPWIQKADIRIFNKHPYYEVDLMPYFSKGNTIDVAEELSLAIQLALGEVLLEDDRIAVFGTAIEEKKNSGNEELAARIEALELALAGRLTNLPANTLLGRNTNSGTVETISQTQFAKPIDIDTAIFNLIGGAPGALNTLDELSAALADDPSFAATVTNNLALKAPLANPSFSGVVGTQGQVSFPATQNPSSNPNILDDYEEGTWTATITYTSPGSSAITFSRNTGRYQKVGNQVSVSFDIRISSFSKGTASGNLIIAGLPFTPRASGGFDNNFGFLIVGNSTFSGIPYIQTASGLSSGNVLFVFKSLSGTVATALDDPISGAIYWGQIQYESAN
jgi:hypothetical protein